jgi:hypothetical protein
MFMKITIALEELAIFAACIAVFATLDFAWWWFPALLLVPDVGMFGYLFGPRAGAVTYNSFHHRAVPIGLGALGILLALPALQLAAVIGMAHISMDRMLGYGLKTTEGFRHTHLGEIDGRSGEASRFLLFRTAKKR